MHVDGIWSKVLCYVACRTTQRENVDGQVLMDAGHLHPNWRGYT